MRNFMWVKNFHNPESSVLINVDTISNLIPYDSRLEKDQKDKEGTAFLIFSYGDGFRVDNESTKKLMEFLATRMVELKEKV